MQLDRAAQLLAFPEDVREPLDLQPDGSAAWQATVGARIETLHRLTARAPAATRDEAVGDPFGPGGYRHAALLLLLARARQVGEPAALELGLMAELLMAASRGDGDAAGRDLALEPWRLVVVDEFLGHLRRGHSHLSPATLGAALVPVWRIDSHVVPTLRRWVWSSGTPLAATQLRMAADAAAEPFVECALLLDRLGATSADPTAAHGQDVARAMAALWAVHQCHELRHRRLLVAPIPAAARGPEDQHFAKACRRELARSALSALRAIARLSVPPSLQRALRVFCARHYDLAVQAVNLDVPVLDMAPVTGLAGALPRSRPPQPHDGGPARSRPTHPER